jgi:amino acid permease
VINGIPLRKIVLFSLLNRHHSNNYLNCILSVIFITCATVIAIFYPDVIGVLSIIGGLCSVTICFLIPCMCYVKLSEKKWYEVSNLKYVLFFGLLCLIGYSSVMMTLYSAFK